MISIDNIFKIGDSHKICEDYALSKTFGYDEQYIAIISDGCSSSSQTDIGSRLVSIALEHALSCISSYIESTDDIISIINKSFISKLIFYKKLFWTLDTSFLDATAIGVTYYNNKFYVYATGDGVITIQRGSETEIIHIKYEDNAPYYASYILDEPRNKQYSNEFIIENGVTITKTYLDSIGLEVIEKYSATEFPIFSMIIDDIEDQNVIVTVMSDGVESFYEKSNPAKNIPYSNIIPELVRFKNTNGEFVTRRANRFLKTVKSNGLDHYDDLSIASICSSKK